MIKCDVYNPTSATRVIHGGEDGRMPIRIDPRETKNGVLLPEHVVTMLRDRADIMGAGKELLVKEIDRSGDTFKFPDPKEAVDPHRALAKQLASELRDQGLAAHARKDADDDGDGRSKIGTASFKKP